MHLPKDRSEDKSWFQRTEQRLDTRNVFPSLRVIDIE